MCVLNQNRSFYNRKGRSKTGKGCLKTGKAVRKQEKNVQKHVAYTLNFTYTEQNTKFTIGFGMVGKLRVKSPCVPQKSTVFEKCHFENGNNWKIKRVCSKPE